MPAVVYTAIVGGHDSLKQPIPQDESCDFICFTDARIPSRADGWRVINVRRDPKIHPRMQAKWFKLLSHRVFPRGRLALRFAPLSPRPRTDLSIWVDGSFRIKTAKFVRDIRAALGGHDWAMFAHPDRNCIYDEARVSATMVKYRGLPVGPQVESYRPVVPPHGGLYACSIIARREPVSDRIRFANEQWWAENVKWTYQDQLSLPYVLRKIPKCEPHAIPGQLRRNGWFDIVPHNTDA